MLDVVKDVSVFQHNKPKLITLKKRSEFVKLSQSAKKFHSSSLIILIKPNILKHIRFGFTVSGKVGNAVVRNKVKRQIREIIRKSKYHVLDKNLDIVLIAKYQIVGKSFIEIEQEIINCFSKNVL